MSIYAVSDLHGQFNTFLKGLDKIGFTDDDLLYVIGDAIDRGPDGIKLLQYIKDHDNMDLLLGNHEFMMLHSVNPDGEACCDGNDAELWLDYNGGRYTYAEYESLDTEDRQALLAWLNERYIIKTLDVGKNHFCLTHSYYDQRFENKKYSEMSYDDVWDIVWKSIYRNDLYTHGRNIYPNYDYTFVTGHVPVQIVMEEYAGLPDPNMLWPYENGNLINIDGGCGLRLCADLKNGALFYRLDDKKTFPIPLV